MASISISVGSARQPSASASAIFVPTQECGLVVVANLGQLGQQLQVACMSAAQGGQAASMDGTASSSAPAAGLATPLTLERQPTTLTVHAGCRSPLL